MENTQVKNGAMRLCSVRNRVCMLWTERIVAGVDVRSTESGLPSPSVGGFGTRSRMNAEMSVVVTRPGWRVERERSMPPPMFGPSRMMARGDSGRSSSVRPVTRNVVSMGALSMT